ncbi:hypothetical protein MTO96_046362 [Rhipicephalus appendiculatus]
MQEPQCEAAAPQLKRIPWQLSPEHKPKLNRGHFSPFPLPHSEEDPAQNYAEEQRQEETKNPHGTPSPADLPFRSISPKPSRGIRRTKNKCP